MNKETLSPCINCGTGWGSIDACGVHTCEETCERFLAYANQATAEKNETHVVGFSVIDPKTGKYPDLEDIALHEEWAKGLCYCDMDGFCISENGCLILMDECGRCAYPPDGRFKIIPA